MSKFCTGCGKPLQPGLKFCTNCGKPVEASEPQSQTTAQRNHAPAAPKPAQNTYQPAQTPRTYEPPTPRTFEPPTQQDNPPVTPTQPTTVQPVTQAPAPSAREKDKKWLILGLSIVAGVVIAAAVILLIIFVFNQDNTKSSSDSAPAVSAVEEKTEAAETKAEAKTEKATEKAAASGDLFGGEDDIDLTIWVPDTAKSLTEELCESFKSDHSDKSITLHVEVMSEGDAATQLLNDQDSAADIFGFASDQLKRLYDTNALDPVKDADLVNSRNESSSCKAASVDGVLYAYPETADNGYYLVYDKSIVSDEDAKTLEGVLKACKAAGKQFVIESGNGFYSCMFIFTGGLSLDGMSDGAQQFNDYDADAVVDSLCAFAKLFYDYSDVILSKEVSAIGNGFSSGTVAAGIDGSWNSANDMDILGDNFGAAKLPTININGEDKQIISFSGYKFLGVKSTTKFPNAAHLLADYLTDEDAQTSRAEQLSWGPTNLNSQSSDAVSGNPALAAVLEQAKYSVPLTEVADTFWTPMQSLGSYVASGETDSAAMKDELEKTITNMKDE